MSAQGVAVLSTVFGEFIIGSLNFAEKPSPLIGYDASVPFPESMLAKYVVVYSFNLRREMK